MNWYSVVLELKVYAWLAVPPQFEALLLGEKLYIIPINDIFPQCTFYTVYFIDSILKNKSQFKIYNNEPAHDKF